MPRRAIDSQRSSSRSVLTFVALMVAVMASDVRAQSGSSTQPSLAKLELFIVNDADTSLNFQLSCDDEDDEDTWENFSLARGAGSSYNCPSLPHVWIRVSTDGRHVQYQLHYRKRYRLAWNSSSRLWDVFAIGER